MRLRYFFPALAMAIALSACFSSSDTGTPDNQSIDTDGDGALDRDDCAPTDPTIHPGAVDVCNAVDDDCDGAIDEDPDLSWYPDADGDGYGANEAPYGPACEPASEGQVTNKADCDDANPRVFPGATDVCNNSDDDCDGEVDEGIVAYVDIDATSDGDGSLDAPFRSITAALEQGSGCIGVRPGAYIETLDVSRPVAIFSFGGSSQTFLLPTKSYRPVVSISTKEEGTLLQGFTVSGGYAGYGGGVYISAPSSTLRDVVLDVNGADYAGGGLSVTGGDIFLDQVDVIGNTSGSGGGVYVTNAAITAVGLTVSDNSAAYGGGIYVDYGGSADLIDSVVSGNVSAYCGGGIYTSSKSAFRAEGGEITSNESSPSGSSGCGGALYASSDTTVELSDLTVQGNTSSNCGAGLYLYGADTTLLGIDVDGNTSAYAGGGLYAAGYAAITGQGLSFDSNESPYGGALYLENFSSFDVQSLSLTHNTGYYGAAAYFVDSDIDVQWADISDNLADGVPGIYTYGTNFHLTNSIVDANQRSTGSYEPYIGAIMSSGRSYLSLDNVAVVNDDGAASIYLDSDSTFDLVDTIVAYSYGYGLYSDSGLGYTIHYSDFFQNGSGDLGGTVSVSGLGADVQFVDPEFVKFSADFRSSNDDLHLAAGSPLIDAGDPDEDNNDPDGSRGDVGAYGGPGAAW
jgi:hypothetical protein